MNHEFAGAYNGDLFAAILGSLGIDVPFGDPAFQGSALSGVFV